MKVTAVILFVLLCSCKPQSDLVPRITSTVEQVRSAVEGKYEFKNRGATLRSPWGPSITDYYFPYMIASVPGVLSVEYDTSVRVVAVSWQSGPIDSLNISDGYYWLLYSHDSALGHVLRPVRLSQFEDISDAFEKDRGKRDSRRPLIWFEDSSNAVLRYTSETVSFFDAKSRH